MNLKQIKPVLLLLLTLLLGFFLGVLGSRFMVERRINAYRGQDRGKAFVRLYEDILGLEDGQNEKVEPVLVKYFEKLRRHRSEIRLIMDSMHQELTPLLTEEQVIRLDSLRSRSQRRIRRGPPPQFP